MTAPTDDPGLPDDPVTDTSVFRLAESVRYLAAMIDRLIPAIKTITVQHYQYPHPLLCPPPPPSPNLYPPYVAAQGVPLVVQTTPVATSGAVSS